MGCGVGCFPGLFLGILTRRARFELPVSPSVFRPLFFFFFFFFFEVGAAFEILQQLTYLQGVIGTWRCISRRLGLQESITDL